MRYSLLLVVSAFAVLFAATPKSSDLPLISRLNDVVQERFRTPFPNALGMSRAVIPNSMGRHFQPIRENERDFVSETPAEKEIIQTLEDNHDQVGLYLVGRAILNASADAQQYRTLKGPAAITRGTPRPEFYPGGYTARVVSPHSLPDWNAIYPLAKRAMQSFEDGGSGFETTLDDWNIAARPVASEERCAKCHGVSKIVGGVLYAFRHADNSSPE